MTMSLSFSFGLKACEHRKPRLIVATNPHTFEEIPYSSECYNLSHIQFPNTASAVCSRASAEGNCVLFRNVRSES